MAIEYLDHTADLGLRATGGTIEEAFCEAARGLFGAMIALDAVAPRRSCALGIAAESEPDLLVEWLSELLAQKDLTGLVFSSFDVRIERRGNGWRLEGRAFGEPLDPARHHPRAEVKGISYLGLEVAKQAGSWQVRCVMDV